MTYSSGVLKYWKNMTKTNRLSTERVFSMMNPVKKLIISCECNHMKVTTVATVVAVVSVDR